MSPVHVSGRFLLALLPLFLCSVGCGDPSDPLAPELLGVPSTVERDPGHDGLDSDGDGYQDLDEISEGTNPFDSDSRIYSGGWPYNPDKDSIVGPSWDSVPSLGERIPRLTGIDQFGEEVDLYDFAGQGIPVFVDIATEWCEPCRAVAEWLDNKDPELLVDRPWWQERWRPIPGMIERGEAYWVTVIHQDLHHDFVDAGVAVRWYEDYPTPWIPVLADPDAHLWYWLQPTGYPTGNVVDDDMVMLTVDNRGLEDSLDMLLEFL